LKDFFSFENVLLNYRKAKFKVTDGVDVCMIYLPWIVIGLYCMVKGYIRS